MSFRIGDYVYIKNFSNRELVRSQPNMQKLSDPLLVNANVNRVNLYKIVGTNTCELMGLDSYYVTDGVRGFEIRTPDFIKFDSDLNAKIGLEDFINE
jgi:hypothetical protein